MNWISANTMSAFHRRGSETAVSVEETPLLLSSVVVMVGGGQITGRLGRLCRPAL